jgi:hypothetical protein
MNEEQVIIHTRARPVTGVFPLIKLREELSKYLLDVSSLIEDYFAEEEQEWKNMKLEVPAQAFGQRLVEINRDRKMFGDVPTVCIEGRDKESSAVIVLLGEKVITARTLESVNSENRHRLAQVIPPIKQLIAEVYPAVHFDDVTI